MPERAIYENLYHTISAPNENETTDSAKYIGSTSVAVRTMYVLAMSKSKSEGCALACGVHGMPGLHCSL